MPKAQKVGFGFYLRDGNGASGALSHGNIDSVGNVVVKFR